MTRVDCDDCTMNFQTKKLYIKHLKSKECTRSKHSSSSQGTPAAKKPRLEGQALNESLLKVGLPQQNTAQYSQKQMEVLQSQITQLSQKQKELLQAQITQKQRQVLQAIPYNQLSEKQKEILKRLSASKPASPTTPTVAPTTPTPVQIRPAVPPQVSATGQPSIKKGRRKNVYNKIPELKNGQIVRVPNTSFVTKAPEPREPVESEPIIKEFVFSDDPIAAESIEIAGEAVTMVAPTEFVGTEVDAAVSSIVKNPLEMSIDQEESGSKSTSKVGRLKIKPIANAFQEITNIVAPTATPKETCPHCKKIFSKAGMNQHIETRHKIQCGYCELKFLQEELNVHIQDHMAPCSICKDVVVKDSMNKHIEIVHKEECSKCKGKFLKTELKDHVRNIHEPEGCDDCESRFETKDDLTVHVNSAHLVEKCEECVSRFKTGEELDKHVVEVHPKEYCEEDECDAVFGTVALLDEHKEKVHPNPNKFVSFNGGMFMMMMVQDEEEEKDEEELETEEVDDSNDVIKELEEAEKAATYQFFEELVIETAHNVVKTAMTGKILFALRFNEEETDVDEEEQTSKDSNEEEQTVITTDNDLEDVTNNDVEDSEEPSSASDPDPLDFVETSDYSMEE